MNLILNVNENLHSILGSVEGEQKKKSAIEAAIEEIKNQAKNNQERIRKGLKPLPYNAIVKDEYGKDFVTIKETRSLGEIRQEYLKRQESNSYENRENNLLLAMNEIGNSEKNEYAFKEDLNKQLNSSLFISDANLTPAQEKILDYFGDYNGIFNTINFKEDISAKCIKDLIDLPDPNTGKPPKSFEHLLKNIMSISKVFKSNPNRDNYIEIARNYINIRYQKIIPENYKSFFKERGNLKNLVSEIEGQNLKNKKINDLEFEVSEKNFKSLYQSFCTLSQFKNNMQGLAKYLIQRVPPEKKESFTKWMDSIGCKDSVSTMKILTKWSNEAEKTKNVKEPEQKVFGLRGE